MNSFISRTCKNILQIRNYRNFQNCSRFASKHARPNNVLRIIQKNDKSKVLNSIQDRYRFSSTSSGLIATERLLIDSIKRRAPKKKITPIALEGLSENPIVALSTAEEYNLDQIHNQLQENGSYELSIDNPVEFENEVLHFNAKYTPDNQRREFFIFSEGSIVFWNMPSNECEIVLQLIRDGEIGSYDKEIVREEKEEIDVVQTATTQTKFNKGFVYLNTETDPSISKLEKFAFSNAIALSVKLSILEANLDRYIDSIAYITQDMKEGKKIKLTRDQVFKKTGQLFGLRHRLNLSSDMLDTPDFYWDREDLEKIFSATHAHLNINKRTKVMNEKLNHCIELMDLLSEHLNDIHHVRLEWMIIWLIMIEVCFEIVHYVDRFIG